MARYSRILVAPEMLLALAVEDVGGEAYQDGGSRSDQERMITK